MSEPMDYAWGMLKQESSLSMVIGNQQGQGGLGTQLSVPIGRSGAPKQKIPGLASRLFHSKEKQEERLATEAQKRAIEANPLPHQQKAPTPPPLPGRGKAALGAMLTGAKKLGQIGAGALSAAEAQQSGSLMGTLGAAQSGYLQAGAALSPLDRFSQRTQDMYGARQDYEAEQATAAQQAKVEEAEDMTESEDQDASNQEQDLVAHAKNLAAANSAAANSAAANSAAANSAAVPGAVPGAAPGAVPGAAVALGQVGAPIGPPTSQIVQSPFSAIGHPVQGH